MVHRNSRPRASAAVALAAALLATAVAGCGSSESTGSSKGLAFTIAFPADPGIQDTPLLATIEELNSDGWDIEKTVMNDQALQTEALATGQIQMSAGNATTAIDAVAKGANLVMLGERSTNDWIVVSKASIGSCDELDGKKVAYHSESSPSTLMLRTWLEENCQDAKPKMLVMEGSSNRSAALVGGQIDASVVQVADWVAALGPEGNNSVHELAKLSETSVGNLIASAYVSPTDWVEENTAKLAIFFETLLRHNREFKDPAAFSEAAVKLLPGLDKAAADRIVAAYGDTLFLPDGGITPDRVNYTLDFMLTSGSIEEKVDPESVVDRRPLDAALEKLD